MATISAEQTSPSTREAGDAADRRAATAAFLARRGGYLVLAILIVIFCVASPHAFASLGNVRAILELAAVPGLFAAGVTLVVLAGEFDLSFTAVAGLGAATAAVLMAHEGLPWVLAVVITLVVGLISGATNAFVTVHQRVQSFIATLAMGSVLAGIETSVGKNAQIFSGIPSSFITTFADKPLLGLTTVFWIALIVAICLMVFVRFSAVGHQIGAIGGSREAAAFAGVPVRRRLALVFVMVGGASALGGVLLVGQQSSYFPNASAGYLLSSYTAVFVGLAFNRHNRFSVGGSLLGVLLITILQDGLSITNQPVWATSVFNGAVLIVAVRITLGKRRHV